MPPNKIWLKSAVGSGIIFTVKPRKKAITIIFKIVPSPNLNLRGIQANITKQLIQNDAQPMLTSACNATP